jgi:flagellar biosynthetic protein FliO
MSVATPPQEHRTNGTEQPGGASPPDAPARLTAQQMIEELRAIQWREPKAAWRQLVALFGLPKLIGGLSLVVLVLVAFVLPGGEQTDPFDGPGAALDLTLKLGAVLALAYVSLAFLKRYTAGSITQRGTLLDVLDSKSLGPNRSVYVVRAGDKRLVLGVTQHQITALAELDAEPAASAALEIDEDLPFAAHLEHAEETSAQASEENAASLPRSTRIQG